MESPVRVTFRDLTASDQIERLCRGEAEKLARFHGRITDCHVRIARLHPRHRKGNLYDVRVDLVLPGSAVVVEHTPAEHARTE
ncbi:MAG: 30S ribosomal protein S30, partial [Planctomycetes bacterium]|nr:30S ribosomal protein S30 [Planctomycetota bacterium]